MSEQRYVLGIDFGTESCRALLVEVATGREAATAVAAYEHGVIDEKLPVTGKEVPLGPDWALQDPEDYLRALRAAVPQALREGGVDPAQVIGVGVDFTACTLIPTKTDGTPLCLLPEFRANPNAWVKLWKHHAAQPEADRINALARDTQQPWLARYGGKVSSEWFFSKTLQILDEAPEVYAAADRLIEAGDWIVWLLTGIETRNACAAGYKAMWSKSAGFPDEAFLRALDPRLDGILDGKMSRQVSPVGNRAGFIDARGADLTGLKPGTAVAVSLIDAHAAVPATGVTEPGRMAMIMGTSTCHMVLGDDEYLVPGISGYVEDGMLPGFFGYEAGQACSGDHFAWFVENCVPAAYERDAQARGISLHRLLEERATRLKPGESGLLALDWWNGNRNVLVDADLTGLLLGATLTTRPEEIYRALIEATAFGTRVIIERFDQYKVPVNEIVACGGLSKNRLLMQIYADVTGREFKLAASDQTSALGSAMLGALAAGREAGGFDTIVEAARAMTGLRAMTYQPNPVAKAVYDRLYREYLQLHDYFGRGENDVMKTLKAVRLEALHQNWPSGPAAF